MDDLNRDGTGHAGAAAIDRLLAGALAEGAAAAIRTHAATCTECAQRLASAERDRDVFLARNPPEIRARQLLAERAARERKAPRFFAPLALAGALAAIALLLVLMLQSSRKESDLTPKGGEVRFSVERAGPAATDGRLAAGDAIRVEVARAGHVAVWSLDDRGVLTEVWREERSRPGPLAHTFVLDDAPGDERLFVVIAPAPPDFEAGSRAARIAFGAAKGVHGIETISVPGADAVASLLIRKVEKRGAP